MIIGVDAGCLSVYEKRLRAGVYQVSFNLLSSLSNIDNDNEYLLYSFSSIPQEELLCFGPNMRNEVLKPSKFWLTVRLSIEFLNNKPDVYVGLSQALPLIHPAKSIVIVYDLAFEYYPDCYPTSFRRLSRQTKFAVRHSSKIIATSNSTRNDLLNLYKIDEEKVKVIYPGVDSIFKPRSSREISRLRKKYGVKSPYFLFVGSLKPIKNVSTVIKSFCWFLRKTRKKHQLILVGSDYWLDPMIAKEIEGSKFKKRVINLGYLPRKDLPGLYSGASSFISPSLYEGFGIPLLEAMACGVPVVASNVGSTPELVGNAGLLVNPMGIDEIGNALVDIVMKDQLRRTLRERSLKQVQKFSWHKFAKKILNEIET